MAILAIAISQELTKKHFIVYVFIFTKSYIIKNQLYLLDYYYLYISALATNKRAIEELKKISTFIDIFSKECSTVDVISLSVAQK